ncbi:MAG: hypothetical protein RLZZ135_2576 [Cyanobacteriota bacterium]|jgi:HlyD family secretion protein
MQNATDKVESFIKQLQSPRSIWTMVFLIGGVGVGVFFWQQSQKSIEPPAQITSQPAIKTITALGKLQPQAEVIKLSAPSSTNGNRVERLLVKEGDRVKAGQVITILDSHDRLQAAYDESERQVASARAKLAQIKAGAKSGEIGAQVAKLQQLQVELEKDRAAQVDEITRVQAQWAGDRAAQTATINRLQATLQNAKSELARNQQLQVEGAISTSTLDTKKLALDTAQAQSAEAQTTLNRIDRTSQQQLRQAQTKLQRINSSGQQQVASARATLAQVREVRPVDVRVAQAEIDRAIANAKQAKASLAQASVKSPQAGEVLNIHTRAGEVVSTDGIVEIGQTEQMEALAEVYQSDVEKVRLGQKAEISSEAISGKLTGTVSQIGAQVKRQTIVNTDPSTNIDARIVEVHIKLDRASSQKAAKSTNLQVRVAIDR